MKDNKFIKVVKTFSASEFRELEKFVESPFFSRGRDLSTFFKCIKPFYPGFDSKEFTAENIYSVLYPGKKFDEKTSGNILYKLSSELYSMCKEFLILKGLDEDKLGKKYYLLQKLRERKLYKEFEKEYNAVQSESDELRKGSVEDFLNKHFLAITYIEYCIESGKIEDLFRSIIDAGEYVSIAALIQSYRNPDILGNFVNRVFKNDSGPFNNLADLMIDHLDSEGFLEQLKKNNDRHFPYIEVNFTIYKLGKNPNDHENYFLLKNLFDKYNHMFGRTEKYLLLCIMSSHCIRNLYGKDSDKFTAEEFDIYKKSIDLGVYKYNKNDAFDLGRFRNIVLAAFSMKQYDWLEKFVNDYTGELSPLYKESMKYYSNAYVSFGRKDFGKALENLTKVNYDYFLFKADIKKLMLQIYFELGYYEEAYSMLDSMKHYVSNTKDLSAAFKLRENNFMKFIRELLKIKTSANTKDAGRLESEINIEHQLAVKSWLLEKIKEL